jgi:DNA-directed RNA polymerase alpha subunit
VTLPTLARYRHALERIAACQEPAGEIAAEALLDRRYLRFGRVGPAESNSAAKATPSLQEISAADNPVLLKKVDELGLSVRPSDCMKANGIVYIGDLVRKTEAELLRTPKFSRKSLREIKEVLVQMGLHLGMAVLDWPEQAMGEATPSGKTADTR